MREGCAECRAEGVLHGCPAGQHHPGGEKARSEPTDGDDPDSASGKPVFGWTVLPWRPPPQRQRRKRAVVAEERASPRWGQSW